MSKKFFNLFINILDYEILYKILLGILLENSIIFICDNIQDLTMTVLGFSYLIQPFKWPYIIIPNLPIDLINMIESPVPFLMGILGDENMKKNLINQSQMNYDVVYIKYGKIELYVRNYFFIIFL